MDEQVTKMAGQDREIMLENFELLWEKREEILDRREWRLCAPKCANLGAAYLGELDVTLGTILTLWDSGDWIQDCPECGAHALHVLTAGGSPLSGSGSCSGICRECLEQRGPAHAWKQRKNDGNFNALHGPARKVAEREFSRASLLEVVEGLGEI